MNKITGITITDSPSFLLDNQKRVLELLDIIDLRLSLLTRFIDEFGTVKCVTRDPNQVVYDDLFHDFTFYGLTKSCKSFLAIRTLCENIYQEDAQILLRSTYETYLAIQFVYKNPTELYHFTQKSLGVATGYIKHPTTSKGKSIKNKIINPWSGEIEDFGLSISKLITAIESNFELNVHEWLYKYLCEHTHLNMIASANYWESEKKFTYSSTSGYYQPIIFLEYIMQLYFDFLACDIGIDHKRFPDEFIELNRKGKTLLSKFVTDAVLNPDDFDLKANMINRMAEEKLKKLNSNNV